MAVMTIRHLRGIVVLINNSRLTKKNKNRLIRILLMTIWKAFWDKRRSRLAKLRLRINLTKLRRRIIVNHCARTATLISRNLPRQILPPLLRLTILVLSTLSLQLRHHSSLPRLLTHSTLVAYLQNHRTSKLTKTTHSEKLSQVTLWVACQITSQNSLKQIWEILWILRMTQLRWTA